MAVVGHEFGDRDFMVFLQEGLPSGHQDIESCHATQKPVECKRRPMLNNSVPGDTIYEPFLGRGTSLIAA